MKGILESKHNRLTSLFRGLISCSLLLALAGNAVNLVHAGQVGTTTGSFEVTAGGQAAYSMGIEVPPGIMGVVPQVAITYNSGGGNGLLGLGASLSGLSAISRCGKSIAQDGVAKAVQFTGDDFFCLNGQRLILMSGSYGADNSTYQTMVESYQKVTAKGSVAGGPAYFEVLAKGGSKLVFGKSLDNSNHLERSIDPVTGVVASWGISYLEDKHSNRVVYEYEDASRTVNGFTANQIVPKRITYGHNAAASVVGKLAVEFVYETRPDTAKGYARGQQFVSDLRLSNIKTRVDTDVVRDYRVSYDQAPVGMQSRITQITECSGGGNCLLPVSFTWNDYSLGWVEGPKMPTAALNSQGKIRGVSIDVNNDGHTDWVSSFRNASGNNELKTYLNTNGTWTPTSDFVPPAPIFDYQRHADGVAVSELVDLNGDGLVDWVVAYKDDTGTNNNVYLNDGSGWVLDSSRNLPKILSDFTDSDNPKQVSQLIDLNGDALPDMVSSYRLSTGYTHRRTWLNTGTGWEQNDNYQLPEVVVDYREYDLGAATGFFSDINNDGLSDFVRSFRNAAGTWVRGTWLNTGNGWQAWNIFKLPVPLVDYSQAEGPVGIASIVDINGDGLLDVVRAHAYQNGNVEKKVWLNTGNGWVVDAGLVPPTTLWDQVGTTIQTKGAFIDRNNDGLLDMVISYHKPSGTSANTVWRNTGDGWVEDASLAMSSYLMRIDVGKDSYPRGLMIDANSDGRADMLWSLGWATSVVRFEGTNDEDFARPEVVTHFSDGLGNAYTPTYTPATYNDVYTPYTDGQYPNLDASGSMLLVSAVESSVGVDVTSRAEHQYFGKKVNLQGRGDLGFAKKVAIDTRTNMRIETEFSQQWPYSGSPLSMKKITEGGTVLMESTNSYQTLDLFNGKTFTIYQDVKTGINRELNGQEIDQTTNEVLSLDDFGNVLSTKTTRVYKARNTDQTYLTTKTNTYNNDVSGWNIGQVITSSDTVTAPGTPSITSRAAFTYLANRNLHTKVAEPGSDEAVTETYAYDDFGHITSTSISAVGIEPRTTTATYTADGRFAATATNTLGHTAASEYHSHFGQVTRTEGPNGSVTVKLYDEHGRMIKTSKIRTEADATNAEDQANNVIVFHPCSDEYPCPSNAAYFLAAFDNEGESPETVYYDNRNREVRKQTQGFDGTSVYVDTLYDEFGRKASITKPYYKDGDVHITQYQYDLLGRVNKIITPAGKELNSTYYAGRTVVTNPAGQTKTTYVNGQGKPAKVVDHQGNELHYTYDAAGRLLTTMGGSDVSTKITIEYDEFGRKIRQDDPDLGEWEYRYDVLGQLVWQQDAKGQTVTMEYDDLGRIIERTEPEGVTQWQYDFGNNAVGKLSRVWNDTGYERQHVYDDYGRAIEVTTVIDGDSTTIKTDYHLTTDKVQYVKYPSGLKIRKEFNDYGFPLSIRSSSQDYLERYEAASAEAQTLVEAANAYKDATASDRAGFLEIYETEKGNAEEWQLELEADQRRYHRALPGYNDHIDRQRESVNQAKHFERWGNSFREDGLNELRIGVVMLYAAEYLSAKAERKAKAWSDFDLLNDEGFWPNGGGLDELQQFLLNVLPAVQGAANLPSMNNVYSQQDLAHTAAWVADHAEAHSENGKRQMNEAVARYDQVKVHVAAAEAHAGHAEVYYELHLQHISDRIDWRAGEINEFYDLAIEAADEIEVIDTALKAKVDLAVNAQRQAKALLNYYQAEASDLHWMAVSADAQGKVTEFTQGQHVTPK